MRRQSTARSPHKGKHPSKIRVFVVEDHLLGIEGLKVMMELSPEGDLEYVGCQTRNTPDLPHLVEEAKADVVQLSGCAFVDATWVEGRNFATGIPLKR